MRWRRRPFPALVLRVEPSGLRLGPGVEGVLREGFLLPTPDGCALLAFLAVCKHLCCIPGWRETALAREFRGEDNAYGSCHHSVYTTPS